MSKPKYKYTVREVLVKYFSNEGWTKSGHELLKLNLQETKEVKLKPKYISPEIEEMKRLSDEFFSKYLINSKQGEEKPNNSWEIEFDNRDLGCCGGDSCPHYVVRQDENGNNVGTNHDEVLKDFITKTLQQQREVDLRTFNSAIDCASSDAIEVVGNSALAYDQAINGVRKYLKKFYKQENK